MTVFTYTLFLPLILTSVPPGVGKPEYMLGSPENLLSYHYDIYLYEIMLQRGVAAGFDALYMVAYSEDDPTVTPWDRDGNINQPELDAWRVKIEMANSYGYRVHLFLAEEETMNDPRWPTWYAAAVATFDDLNIVWVISEEYNQPPHGLLPAQVEDRCEFLRILGTINPIGVHDTGTDVYGLWPFRTSACIDVLHVQWYRTADPLDALDQLGDTGNKYVLISEPPTYPVLEANWCTTATAVMARGAGIGLYHGDHDQWWTWDTLPFCDFNI